MMRVSDDQEPVSVSVENLTDHLALLCPQHRIDLAGAVCLPCSMPLAERFQSWITSYRHGDLDYMTRTPEERLDPSRRNPWARSLLIFAQRYVNGWPTEDHDPVAGGCGSPETAWTDHVSRYARGQDYHDVLLKDIRAVLAGLATEFPGMISHASTDTGPFLEREYAWLAGLGFLGKNTCLIHERLGSGMFLGVALTNLQVEGSALVNGVQGEPLFAIVPRRSEPASETVLSACGSCTCCIEACPTDAILPDGGLDAGRCLSNFTIEKQGNVPAEFTEARKGIFFGCDICQAVCPWNHRANDRANHLAEPRSEYSALPDHAQLDLADLATISDEEFRRRFRHTPIWRCHPEGLRRNAIEVGKGQ